MADLQPILLGLLTGFLFGFILQKGQVTKFDVIVGQFLFKDFTMLKVMLTAVLVGGAGVYAFLGMGLTKLTVKPALMGGVILGGIVFSLGMTLLGYCPGTSIAAAAQGARDAGIGVLGMLAGAIAFSESYDILKPTVLKWGDLGKVTLPDLTGWPAWVFFLSLTAVSVPLFVWLEKRESRGR